MLFFPLGLYLMWTRSDWDDDVKWGISGVFLPGLWSRFIWQQRWAIPIKLALSAALLGANELFVVGALNVNGGGPAAIFIINLIAIVLVAMNVSKAREDHSSLRRVIESKLDTCHELIAEVEGMGRLDLLPAESGLRQRYVHALEMREEGMRLFEDALSKPDLVAAEVRIGRALDDLRATRTELRRDLAG